MQYPENTIAKNKRGEKEARILKSRGKFVMYNYKKSDGTMLGKYSILLERENGMVEHLIIVPIKKRELIVKHGIEKKKRGIWDDKNKKSIEFP